MNAKFECKIAKLEAELETELSVKSFSTRNIESYKYTSNVEKLTKSISSSCSQEKLVVKPEDNPEADMTQQLNSNEQKIKELIRQNERLSKTLHRLREHRNREVKTIAEA